MHDLGDMLVHAGFADPVMDQETLTLQLGDAEALLAELRSSAATPRPTAAPACARRAGASACSRELDALRRRRRPHRA